MPTQTTIQAADLFCGAGGTTTGLLRAAGQIGRRVDMLAVNHWNRAIDTHTLNHPGVRHLCESLQNVNPRQAVPGGRLDILCGSPECTHHSRARGGKPRSDQSRAGAFFIVDWCAALRIKHLIIENVPEFIEWGPLNAKGKPIASKKGRIFKTWVASLESLGYRVKWSILNCADYGDPTTRRRLFVIASLGSEPIWPTPTHAGNWRSAREIINWTLEGTSIFTRKKPLCKNTTRRILAGLERFSGLPFLIQWDQTGSGSDCVRSVERPMPTIITKQNTGLATPYLVKLRGTSDSQIRSASQTVEDPLPSITAGGRHICVVQPFLVKYYATGGARPVTEPLDTITTKPRFGLVQPTVELDGQTYQLDIKFRMLQPSELAAGQGFPSDYKFTGNTEDVVCQIGNAVPVNTATALCRAMLEN